MLPIEAIRKDAEAVFRSEKRSVVLAPTGSGKSTRLPNWLNDTLSGPTLVVEPRRVACRSLAGWLSSQDGSPVGERFGYAVRFDSKWNPGRTPILFATPGVGLELLLNGDFSFNSVLMDEFHERSVAVDLLAALLLRAQERGDRDAPQHVCFTSATIGADELTTKLDARLLRSEGRTFPVDISYREDGNVAPTAQGIGERVAGALFGADAPDWDGRALVFLPGMREIRKCEDALRSVAGRVQVDVLHGSRSATEMDRVFADPGAGRRQVILSTNIAETSLTIPGITMVVDSGLVKQRIHRAGRSLLAVVPTSLASMDQRAGRAGRVAAGRCIRLFARRYRPEEQMRPEIERVELDDLALSLARAGVNEQQARQLPWVTPPPEFALGEAYAHLRDLDLVDDGGAITRAGAEAGTFPVSSHLARVLAEAKGTDVYESIADVCAVLETPRGVLKASGDTAVHDERRRLFEGSPGHVFDEVLAMRFGDVRRHALRREGLSEARRIADQLRALGGDEVRPLRDERARHFDIEAIGGVFAASFPAALFVERARVGRKKGGRSRTIPFTNGDLEIAVDPGLLARRGEDTEATHDTALILDHEWVSDSGTGFRGFARALIPVPRRVVRRSRAGDTEIADIKLSRRRGNTRITALVERKVGGVTIDRDEQKLHGELLRNAAAKLLLEGRIIKGAADRVRSALHTWGLLADWPEPISGIESRAPDAPGETDWLVSTLGTLGVESSGDLDLLEVDDLLPDLVELSGVASWDIDSLSQDFPRVWEHLGARYTVEVRARRGRVTLEPESRSAKNTGIPPKHVIPGFRGFAVFFRQASRVQRLR